MLMLNILGIHNNNNNFEGEFLEEKSKKELKGEQGAEIKENGMRKHRRCILAKYFTNDFFNELQQLSGNQYVTSNFENNSNPLKSFKNKC